MNAPPPQSCRLDDLGIVRVAGTDAARFLAGQLSNDRSEGLAPLAGWHDAKGRVRAVVRIVPRGSDTLLVTEREQVEPLLRNLRLYVLRDDVALADAGGEAIVTGLRVEAGLAGADWPESVDECRELGRLVLARIPDPEDGWRRYLAIGADGAPPLADGVGLSADGWRLLDVRCGLARLGTASAGRHVAQMLNLDLVGAVRFDKGCYVGQEVVARAHHLGRVKRRLFRFAVAGGAPAVPGEVVRLDTAQACGAVVTAAPAGPASHELLAVIRLEALEAPLALTDRRPLERLGLPGAAG